ncbi:LysR family transcriptional regulator [Xenophilus arseniciresistens]|uniref:LysR family transcriptional regulator n=1 Tax=Xenophilus arseniciresistens TaxID=1283306 RepID=A0AAE3N7U1_9BURK|nr:LysR family transcriptional regulator [Xenophilus arseniciresistens]MDA7414854.1 LysR family transcriptional regulator [Xenophilus arseniciresistens]
MNKAAIETPSTAADRLALMQTFVRIVEAGSLSAAAAQMMSTQPTVSRRLQALERLLGVRLLQRSTHAMHLTEDGARCYARAKALIADWDALAAELHDTARSASGLLRVVVPHAFGQSQLVAPLVAFLQAQPEVDVEWLLEDQPVDFVGQGIDCAIQVGEVQDPAVVAIRLAEVPRIVLGAPSLLDGAAPPAHPRELAGLPWLAFQTYYRHQITLQHAGTGELCELALRPRLSSDSLYPLRMAALQGLGVGVFSAWLVQEDLASGRLLHLVPQWQAASLPVHLVYPYARQYPARLRRFVELMRQHALAGAVQGWAGPAAMPAPPAVPTP